MQAKEFLGVSYGIKDSIYITEGLNTILYGGKYT